MTSIIKVFFFKNLVDFYFY